MKLKIYKNSELGCYDSKWYVVNEQNGYAIGCSTKREAQDVKRDIHKFDVGA